MFNIGEVLAQLSEEFPSVTASKIRFYEEKGLITPQRTPAGYRQFAESDVERLRFVLGLQRDHYLPLKVIRDYLDAIEIGRA
ncbi:MAG: MerR family transcriptional regulator, partial [Acidobacteria bacterium]|nr:MerR family transcriptional regulator [Acidobacteriota bacterium]